MSQYLYTVTVTPGVGYVATLNRGDNKALIQVGTRKLRSDAEAACKKHYEKAVSFLARMGKPVPEALFL